MISLENLKKEIHMVLYKEVGRVNLEQLRRKYEREWIAVKILKEDKRGNILECELIAHNREKAKLHKELREKEVKDAYVTFAGELEPGYVVMLYKN